MFGSYRGLLDSLPYFTFFCSLRFLSHSRRFDFDFISACLRSTPPECIVIIIRMLHSSLWPINEHKELPARRLITTLLIKLPSRFASPLCLRGEMQCSVRSDTFRRLTKGKIISKSFHYEPVLYVSRLLKNENLDFPLFPLKLIRAKRSAMLLVEPKAGERNAKQIGVRGVMMSWKGHWSWKGSFFLGRRLS